jgi:tetratricopeptide (TPR) repeat protein
MWAALFTFGLCLVLLPVAYRNYYVGREFLISTSQLGSNLYIGNHPGAQGTYEPLVPGHGSATYEREDAVRLAEDALGRKLSPEEVSNYWVRRSWDYIKASPGAWLRLMLKKVLLTFSATEAADTESIQAYARFSWILTALSWMTFGVVLPIAIFGVWMTRDRWRELWLLYALTLTMAAAVALFYVVARYRYPLVPIVILFAGAGLSTIPSWRKMKRSEWLPGAVIALVVAVPCNFLFRNSNDVTFLNFGQELVRLGKAAEGVPLLQTAVKDSPDDAQAHFNLAVALNQTGRKEEALDEFTNAIKLAPEFFEAHAAMALTLLETGRPAGAVQHFREAVRLKPDLPGIRMNLANALMQSGNHAEAIKEYDEALRIDPNNAGTHNSLAVALQKENRINEAIVHYESALRLQPDDAETHSNYALALETAGKTKEAVEHLQTALQLQPQNTAIRLNLADMLVRFGRVNEAIPHYQEAAAQTGSFEMYFELAQVCLSAGRSTEAIASLEKALTIARNTGHFDEAQQIATQLNSIRSQPNPRN